MKKYYLIGNAHLDPVWMWNWQEGCSEAKATVRSALDRMKEYPDFVFTCAIFWRSKPASRKADGVLPAVGGFSPTATSPRVNLLSVMRSIPSVTSMKSSVLCLRLVIM